jgi:hypothetical protein
VFPRPPAIPASLAVLVLLAGLGLVYWSLSSFGAFTSTDTATGAPGAATGATDAADGGTLSGGNATGGGGAGGGF